MIKQFRVRLLFISALLLLFLGVVVSRLFIIQVINSERYVTRCRDQSHDRKIIRARRGAITDRSEKAFAVSTPECISVDADLLGLDGSRNTSLKRVYPNGDLAGSLLGYIGRDGHGLGGAEFAFDRYLRGEDGWAILQKDGKNLRYRKIGLPEKPPTHGCTIVLTLDLDIQKIAQTVLRQTVEKLKAKGGLCIVMKPNDGSILAMADEPSFNPNIPSRYPIRKRQNRCISAVYEPGSTFKLVTASAAMQEKIKSENDLIYGDQGRYVVYHQVIRDHVPYGYLTFQKALTYSSNICFAKIANELGNEAFYRYVRDFGFGEQTAIDLPGEETGIVHPIRRWSGRTRVTMAMGQEISATLMQMMLPYAAVANGGILVSPRILHRIRSAEGTTVDSGQYHPIRRVLSESVAARLRIMLEDVVRNGTGKRAGIDNVEVAGKTGTSQKPDTNGYSQTRSWSSFIGFVPVEHPVLLCGVVIDEPEKGEMGGVAAAPCFKNIITQIISNPELEFAEQILHNKDVNRVIDQKKIVSLNGGKGKLFGKKGIHPVTVISGTIPDCVGLNLRDAVNDINASGFTPFAVGSGFVDRQFPEAGKKPAPASVCTLYCSVKGNS